MGRRKKLIRSQIPGLHFLILKRKDLNMCLETSPSTHSLFFSWMLAPFLSSISVTCLRLGWGDATTQCCEKTHKPSLKIWVHCIFKSQSKSGAVLTRAESCECGCLKLMISCAVFLTFAMSASRAACSSVWPLNSSGWWKFERSSMHIKWKTIDKYNANATYRWVSLWVQVWALRPQRSCRDSWGAWGRRREPAAVNTPPLDSYWPPRAEGWTAIGP